MQARLHCRQQLQQRQWRQRPQWLQPWRWRACLWSPAERWCQSSCPQSAGGDRGGAAALGRNRSRPADRCIRERTLWNATSWPLKATVRDRHSQQRLRSRVTHAATAQCRGEHRPEHADGCCLPGYRRQWRPLTCCPWLARLQSLRQRLRRWQRLRHGPPKCLQAAARQGDLSVVAARAAMLAEGSLQR